MLFEMWEAHYWRSHCLAWEAAYFRDVPSLQPKALQKQPISLSKSVGSLCDDAVVRIAAPAYDLPLLCTSSPDSLGSERSVGPKSNRNNPQLPSGSSAVTRLSLSFSSLVKTHLDQPQSAITSDMSYKIHTQMEATPIAWCGGRFALEISNEGSQARHVTDLIWAANISLSFTKNSSRPNVIASSTLRTLGRNPFAPSRNFGFSGISQRTK